jgi:hypothetical protein
MLAIIHRALTLIMYLGIDVSASISLGSSSAYLAPNYLGLGAYSERSLPIEQLEAFHVTSYVPTA